MSFYFIDAVPGTGKTTLIQELRRRGEEAHDTDDECIMISKKTGEIVEYANRKNDPYNWVYPTEKLQELKELSRTKNVFLSGSIDNYDEVRPAIDGYVWMEIPLNILLKRLAERHDDYGNSDSERQSIIELHKEMEKMGHPKAFKLDATEPIEQIADDLLTYATKVSKYREQLTTDFPDMQIKSVRFIGSGWHHDAIEVNGDIVFRIPRFDHDSDNTDESVGYETAILKLLRGKLNVAIPDPLYITKDMSYFGYPKLEGDLLADKWHVLTKDEKDKIIEQWVDIVIDIHKTIDLKTAQELHVPLFSDPTEPINETANKIHEVKGLDPLVYEFADRVLRLNQTIGTNPKQDTLIHNDLHLFNMLIDPDTHELTGVIDWTDVCIGPLEREFCCWEWEQGDTLEKSIQLYTEKTGNTVSLEQARFWKHIETITDIVEAAESNDQKKIDESVEIIKYWAVRESKND